MSELFLAQTINHMHAHIVSPKYIADFVASKMFKLRIYWLNAFIIVCSQARIYHLFCQNICAPLASRLCSFYFFFSRFIQVYLFSMELFVFRRINKKIKWNNVLITGVASNLVIFLWLFLLPTEEKWLKTSVKVNIHWQTQNIPLTTVNHFMPKRLLEANLMKICGKIWNNLINNAAVSTSARQYVASFHRSLEKHLNAQTRKTNKQLIGLSNCDYVLTLLSFYLKFKNKRMSLVLYCLTTTCVKLTKFLKTFAQI